MTSQKKSVAFITKLGSGAKTLHRLKKQTVQKYKQLFLQGENRERYPF